MRGSAGSGGAAPAIERLSADHDLAAFDCGAIALDEWLKRHALINQAAGAAGTYVVVRAPALLGYYALAAGAVEPLRALRRVTKGLGRYPVPVVVLARLAVDRRAQGQGIGRALLKDALLRVAAAADIIGVRALLVHARNDAARRFYERFDFEPSPTDALHLFLLLKDLRKALGSGDRSA